MSVVIIPLDHTVGSNRRTCMLDGVTSQFHEGVRGYADQVSCYGFLHI